ncbi:MAG TPA: nuclear transport factor 2 family protein [Naasia sp.]|jgi:predicted SnoaL-like aldol condensation-catalyzing enzyme
MSTETPNAQDAKSVVLDFFELAFVGRQPDQARDRYLGDSYVQHNPMAPDGPEIFPTLIGGLFAQAPEASFHLKRAIAEDDLVVLHYNLKMFPDDRGQAVVDIFRVEDGRIVEHWDVMQPVPTESNNTNGMF